jgi:hypothetical protein
MWLDVNVNQTKKYDFQTLFFPDGLGRSAG